MRGNRWNRSAAGTAAILLGAMLLGTAAFGAGDGAVRTLTADDLAGLPWRSVGPANMGGRVSAIALVPGSRTAFYVGFATGGLFRTTNLGVTFHPVFDDQDLLSIGAVAVSDAPAGLERLGGRAGGRRGRPRGKRKGEDRLGRHRGRKRAE